MPSGMSDPSVQPTRLICLDKENVALCNGNKLHMIHIRQQENSLTQNIADDGNVLRSNGYSLGPHKTGCFDFSNSLQSLCSLNTQDGPAIASVNSSGCTIVSTLQGSEHDGLYMYDIKCSSHSPGHSSSGSGWAGICSVSGGVATAHYVSKKIEWVDQHTLQPLRTSLSTGNPSCISSFKSPGTDQADIGSIVVTGDLDGVVSVWDARQSARGATSNVLANCFRSILFLCQVDVSTEKQCAATETIECGPYSQCKYLLTIIQQSLLVHFFLVVPCRQDPSGLGFSVVASGSDKVVRLLDCKTWRTRVKWRAPNKYDIAKLLEGPPSTSPTTSPLPLYIVGRDNEVLLCNVPMHMTNQHRGGGDSAQNVRKKMRVEKSEAGGITSGAVHIPPLHHTELPSASKLRMSHHRLVSNNFYLSLFHFDGGFSVFL